MHPEVIGISNTNRATEIGIAETTTGEESVVAMRLGTIAVRLGTTAIIAETIVTGQERKTIMTGEEVTVNR